MPTDVPRATPKFLLLASALLFGAAYFAVRFPSVPGASAGSYAATLLIAAPSFVALWRFFGARRAVFSLAALSLFGYAVETTGVATGFPYGSFYYGDALGPKAFGLVPYILPISYAPLVIGAVAASESPGSVSWILKSAVLLTLIDGVLDPGAALLGFWVWPEGGPYYGVPASNYLGWLFSGALAAAVLLLFGYPRWRAAPPPGLLDSAVAACAFWTGVAVHARLPFPALLGATLFFYLLYRRSRLRARYGKPVCGEPV